MILYDYFRSSAAYRVRIALNFKGIDYEQFEVHLTKDGGQQFSQEFKKVNPQSRVPAIELNDDFILTQSPAIIEWLEEKFPTPELLPKNVQTRAKIRAIASIIGCDIHPLNNLAVLRYLKHNLGCNQEVIDDWYRHWVNLGLQAVEDQLPKDGKYSFGSAPTLADIYLMPQIYNAKRFDVDLSKFTKIQSIEKACSELEPFKLAHPDKMIEKPDATI